MLPIEDVTSLPLLYHLNSEPWANSNADSLIYEMPQMRLSRADGRMLLPNPSQESALVRHLQARRSCRNYCLAKMTCAELGMLLGGACGITRPTQLEPGIECSFRTSPSAGALFPLEIYLATQEIDGMEQGLHHYNALDHSLENLRKGPAMQEVGACLLEPKAIQNANAVILIAAGFERILGKYGARGYRYVLLEAGHVAQSLCLLATSMALGSLCIGGFVDSKLNSLLGLDGATQAVIYCIGIGHSAESE